jgi:hypothetical protein
MPDMGGCEAEASVPDSLDKLAHCAVSAATIEGIIDTNSGKRNVTKITAA